MSYWFHIDEGVMELERGFRDLSAQLLEWKLADGSAMAITIQREELASDATDIDTFVDRSLMDYAKGLQSFHLDSRRTVEATSFPARVLRFRWLAKHGLVCQAQGFMLLGTRLLVLTATCAAVSVAEAEALVLRAITSMRARER